VEVEAKGREDFKGLLRSDEKSVHKSDAIGNEKSFTTQSRSFFGISGLQKITWSGAS
jgi:hypothetical protein